METIELIKRPKLNLLGMHYGVRLSTGEYYDFQPRGFKKISELEFKSGHEIEVEKSIPFTKEVKNRFEKILNSTYHLIDFNCENVARFLVEGESKSTQIQTVTFASLAALLIWFFKD